MFYLSRRIEGWTALGERPTGDISIIEGSISESWKTGWIRESTRYSLLTLMK